VQTRAVLIVCPVCATRYAGRVTPSCGVCEGVGVVVVAQPAIAAAGEWPAARAASLFLWVGTWRNRDEGLALRRRAETAGLVRPTVTLDDVTAPFVWAAPVADWPKSGSGRSAVGRKASALLVALGLRRARAKVQREVVVGRVKDGVGTVRTTVTETHPVAPQGTVDLAAVRAKRAQRGRRR
jgi:hypothetical protein